MKLKGKNFLFAQVEFQRFSRLPPRTQNVGVHSEKFYTSYSAYYLYFTHKFSTHSQKAKSVKNCAVHTLLFRLCFCLDILVRTYQCRVFYTQARNLIIFFFHILAVAPIYAALYRDRDGIVYITVR